jgi:large subunit ribosomal protein L14e
MPYKQFVEVGRVALISFGPLVDQLAVVVDIIDDNRVLIDLVAGPDARQVISIRRLKLTDFKVDIERAAPTADVASALATDGIAKKWAETAWGKKLAANKARSDLTDFQRFKYERHVAKRDEFVKNPKGGNPKGGNPKGGNPKGKK